MLKRWIRKYSQYYARLYPYHLDLEIKVYWLRVLTYDSIPREDSDQAWHQHLLIRVNVKKCYIILEHMYIIIIFCSFSYQMITPNDNPLIIIAVVNTGVIFIRTAFGTLGLISTLHLISIS